MDVSKIAQEALAAIDAALNIINVIRAQGGMADDAILAAADAQTLQNADQIKAILAGLPPATPPAASPGAASA